MKMWNYTGDVRPDFAEPTKQGQESVWDYPRPPIMQEDKRTITIFSSQGLIAKSNACIRVLETAGAPTFYVPPQDVQEQLLVDVAGQSFCEWKGIATYCALTKAPSHPCGWQYREPNKAFATLQFYYGFYPSILECYVDDELVQAQPGGFYGGWVTSEIVGPIKGEPGSDSW